MKGKKWKKEYVGETVILQLHGKDVIGAKVLQMMNNEVYLDILDLDGFPTGKKEWYPMESAMLLEVLE